MAALRAAYYTAIMKTHPDTVGSNRHVESYLQLRAQYEEARENGCPALLRFLTLLREDMKSGPAVLE